MTINEIKTVCYVGAGTMGCYNSLAAAISGYDVVLYDVDANTLAQVPARHGEMAALLVGGGYCSSDDITDALQRVTVLADLQEATARAELVSESVFERLDIKRDIHRRLDQICPPNTILTTNSSRLLVSDIESAVSRGERFAALHSHLGSPLVDIVGGGRTDPAVIDILRRFVLSTRGAPLVLKKEYPGYVLNAMLGPVLGAALSLAITDIASREEVDRAWMIKRGVPMGPFGMMDLFGLNLIFDSWQYREGDAHVEQLRPKVLALLKPYIDRGELGIKSGKGFYQYPNPAYQVPGFLDANADVMAVYNTLAVALVANALLIAAHEVAAPRDIDRAWMVGTGQDTGPFNILQEMGEQAFRQALAGEVAAGRLDAGRAQVAETWLDRRV